MGKLPKEIPNTRHIPQMNGDQPGPGGGKRGASGLASIPNTVDPILAALDEINKGDNLGKITDAEGNEVLSGLDKYLAEMGLMQGLNTNFSHSNKWIGYFPLANALGKKYSNLELNLTRFSIP